MEENEGVYVSLINGIDAYGDEVDKTVTVHADVKLLIDIFERTNMKFLWKMFKECVGEACYVVRIYVHLVFRKPSNKARKDPRKCKHEHDSR